MKLWAAPHAPAKCINCGGLASEPYGPIGLLSMLYQVGFLVAAWGAMALWSWWPLIVYALVLVALVTARLILLPLAPVTAEVAKRESRLRMMGMLAVCALIVVALVLSK